MPCALKPSGPWMPLVRREPRISRVAGCVGPGARGLRPPGLRSDGIQIQRRERPMGFYRQRSTIGRKADASFNLAHQNETLQNTIKRIDRGRTTTFTAVNTCLCVATFREQIIHSDDPGISDETEFRKILQPQSRELLSSGRERRPGQFQSEFQVGDCPGLAAGEARAPWALSCTFCRRLDLPHHPGLSRHVHPRIT